MKIALYSFTVFLITSFILSSCSSPHHKNKLLKQYNQYPYSDIRIAFYQNAKQAKYYSFLSSFSELPDQNLWLSIDSVKTQIVKKKADHIDTNADQIFGKFVDIEIVNNNHSLFEKNYYVPQKIELIAKKESQQHCLLSRRGSIQWVKDSLNQNPIIIQIKLFNVKDKTLDTEEVMKHKMVHIETKDNGIYQFKENELDAFPKDAILAITLQRYHIESASMKDGQVVLETINTNGDYFQLLD